MIYNRDIYNLENFKDIIDNVMVSAESSISSFDLEPDHYFKKESYGHPTAELKNGHDGSFEAIPNRFIRKTPELLHTFKELEEALEISDLILTRYITKFQPEDFLTWRANLRSVGKFFSISTTKCHIQFKDEIIILPPYRAISFNQRDTYSIPNATETENWIVLMIPEIETPLEDYEVHF